MTPNGYETIGGDINNGNLDDYQEGLTLRQVMDSTFLAHNGLDEDDDDVEYDNVLNKTLKVVIGSDDKITVCTMEQRSDSNRFEFNKEKCNGKQYLLPSLQKDKNIEVNLQYYPRDTWDQKNSQDTFHALLKLTNSMQLLKSQDDGKEMWKRDGYLLVTGNEKEREMYLFLNASGIDKLISTEASQKNQKTSAALIGMNGDGEPQRVWNCDGAKVEQYRACEKNRRALGLANKEARDTIDELNRDVLGVPVPQRGKGMGGTDHITEDAEYASAVEARIKSACTSEDPVAALEAKMNSCQTKVRGKEAAFETMQKRIEDLEKQKSQMGIMGYMGYTIMHCSY